VPKSHQRRSVPLPAFLLAELQLLTRGKSPDDLIFTAPGGGPLRNSNFRRDVLDPAAVAVGIPGLRPHDLRHTAASLAIAAGANVKAVQRMLGHASAAMTLDVYAGLFSDDLDDVAARLHDAATRRGVSKMCPAGPGDAQRPLPGDREKGP
jgi:integrase